jgi:deoxyribodipyrimidine photo-lyase
VSGTQLVWFKRDLRLADHRPLVEAAARGPVLALYCYEPSIWAAGDLDATHLAFVNACLAELRTALRRRGGELVLRCGEMPAVLDALVRAHDVTAVWAHEETSTLDGYARDRRVRAWARERGLAFRELPANGVVRRLAGRDGWARRWEQRMRAMPLETPRAMRFAVASDAGSFATPAELGLADRVRPDADRAGGERAAHALLHDFLDTRGVDYRRAMSSPVTAFDACSRISPHLTWGTLSVRQAYHAARERSQAVAIRKNAGRFVDPRWGGALSSFASRLRWRCHFIQKLEDEPELQTRTMCAAYDGLRPQTPDAERLAAWADGRTGYPLVDACMRALRATGWLNFRMRAMVVAFASCDLWLDWRPVAAVLARRFLDYEPGIHYCQVQMQSGVTGINAVRVYNPWKQAAEHDPRGEFVRRWVPELAGVPTDYIVQPHAMPAMVQLMSGCVIGRDYPAPIVDHVTASREALARIFAVRERPETRILAREVYRRHGSRAESAVQRGL